MEKRIIRKQINGLCVIQLQFFLDDDDQLKHCEVLEDEDSMNRWNGYLLLSNSFSLLCFTRFTKIGILSGWNLRII